MDHIQRAIGEMKHGRLVGERRSAAERLDDLLSSDEFLVMKLNCNSVLTDKRAGDRITWNVMFTEVREYFSKETERGSQSLPNRLFYIGLVRRVFETATCNGPLISWSKVYDFLITHLQKERHASLFGQELMGILQRFLEVELYRSSLDAPSYIDLIKTLLKCHKRNNITIGSLLNCMRLCIAGGSQYDTLVPCIRTDVVQFYSELAQKEFGSVQQHVLSYLQGLNELCKQNAIEFRGILCSLGETVIPFILQIPSFNEDEDAALVEFLLMQYSLHMPRDCDMNSKVFYASDPARWKEILRLLYSYCIDHVDERGRRLTLGDVKFSERFLLLAAKCTKQISSPMLIENENSDDEDGSVHSKKKMRYKSFNTIISDVYRKPLTEGLTVWIRYLTAVLTEFPELIETKMNLSNLMHLGASMFNTRFMVRREFYEFFFCLLEAEKYLQRKHKLGHMSDTWGRVWDLTIKCISVCEEKQAAVSLLRKMLKELRPSNITPLLLLYVNNYMPLEKCSVELLAEYLSIATLPVHISDSSLVSNSTVFVDEEVVVTSCPRLALIRWLINVSNSDMTGYEPLVAAVMCSLIVKQTDCLIKQETDIILERNKVYYDFENKLYESSFVKISDDEKKRRLRSSFSKSNLPLDLKYVTLQKPAERLADTVQMDYVKSYESQSGDGRQKVPLNYKLFVGKVCLHLNILNVIGKYSIGESGTSGQVGFRAVLESVFEKGMEKCNQFVKDRLQSDSIRGKSPDTITSIIECTGRLFSNQNLCDKMRSSLSQKVTVQEIIKRVFRSHLANYIRVALNNMPDANAMFFADNLPSNVRMLEAEVYERAEDLYLITKHDIKYEKMSLSALRFLIEYGLICNNRSDHFLELIKDLLAERTGGANLFLFDASTLLISGMSQILGDQGFQDLIASILELMQKLCRGYHPFSNCCEKLWEMLKVITPHFAAHEGISRLHFMILFGTLFKLLDGNSKTPKNTYRKAFDAISVLAQHDRGLSWSHFTPSKSGAGVASKVWVLEELHVFLRNKFQEVRQLAGDAICRMYEQALPFDYSKGITDSQEQDISEDTEACLAYQDKRKRSLDAVFKALMNSFDVEAALSAEEIIDEGVNRTSLTLSLLTRLIFAYPYSQKQNIMFLFTMIKLKNIDVQLAKRALEFASENSQKTMCCYFPYVLKKILKLSYAVEDIPYQFFGCDAQNTFLSKFRNEICVEYFEQNKATELDALAQRLNLSLLDLIKPCAGLILARLTPGLAAHSNQLVKSNEIHKRLISTLGGTDTADTLIAACIGDVVLNLVSLTFEPSVVNCWGCPEIKMSEPVPPHYSEDTVETCLEFLKTACPLKNMSLIGYLAKTSHQSIYKILLCLLVRIHDAHDQLEKYWRLHQFSFFVYNMLLKEPKEVFESMMQYVCNFTFNTYLRLLKTGGGRDRGDNEENLRFLKVVVFQITKLVQRITEEYVKEMAVFFNPVVRGIVSVVVEHPQLVHSTKILLDYLLKVNRQKFVEQIISLDPFPINIPEFQEFNNIHAELKYGSRRNDWPLSQEFERFLEGVDNTVAGGSCTKERLQFLRELLITRKRDLDRMVKNIESKKFSEECESDPLHRIIKMLTDIASSPTKDEKLTIEACKCLGEIGPIDLSVLVLPPYKSQGKLMSRAEAPEEIIKLVFGYLSSNDIKLVEVAGETLQSLFEFEECASIIPSKFGQDRLWEILLPFRCTQRDRVKVSMENVDANRLEAKLGLNEMDEGIDYKTWLTQLNVGIIECFRGNSSLVSILLPLCELRLDFCEDVLPYVVYLCLNGGRSNPLVKKIITGYFRNFFAKFAANLSSLSENSRSITPSSGGTTNVSIYMNKLALRSLIRVIQFLRRHPVPQENRGNTKPTPFDNNFWIDLKYLDVARAAQYCGAYLTSILYIEIAATELDMNRSVGHYQLETNEEDSNEQFYTQGASVYPQNRTEAYKMEKLLLKAYSNIGEVDAAFGCGSARFGEDNVYHIEQTMDWPKLLMVANGSSINKDSCSDVHVAQSFKGLGVYNILWTYLKGVESQNQVLTDELHQAQFECGWRLSQWNLNADKPAYIKDFIDVPSQAAFQMSIYESLQTGLMKDQENHLTAIKNGYHSVHTELRHATLESSVNLYGFMSRLQMLRVIEDFVERQDELGTVDVNGFLGKWKLQDRIPVGDFKFQEPVLYLRNVLLRAYDMVNGRVDLESEITESLLGLIAKAREASNLDYADTCAIALSSLISKPCLAREFEVAKNKWARGKPDNKDALFIMNQLLKKSVHDDDLYPSLLLRYGEWLSETLCERPTVILEKYLQRACSLYEKRVGAPQHEISKAFIVLAKYADAQYQNVTKYMSSEVFQAKMEHVNRTKEENRRPETMLDQTAKRNARIMQMHSNNDDDEIRSIQQEQKKFLKLALRHYLKGLKTSNENDLLIFRAISLWLENGSEKDEELIEETTRIFSDETLPSYKYLVVLHQLSARLSNKSSLMNESLKDILIRCAEEHPYHTLPVLLTQASLHKDENMLQSKKNSGVKIQLAGRVQAAAEIVQALSRMSRLKQLVSKMESFWLALITLANMNDGSRNQDGIKKSIPNDVWRQLSSLETIAVPTASVPVLASMNYKDSFVGISGFGKEYALVGGINSPKKIACRGTNGMQYNMLLKGQDDLRQDAVMQQVFGVMNKLLQVEHKTKVRRLHIRTYKVIPLSQRTGVIEWVENTQTLGEYLTGLSNPSLGAHVRYRPNDYKPMECRRLMQDARDSRDPEKRYSTYMAICEHFKPVFRHFFFENFKEAGVFFEKRLAYTRSVATNSIVGYILGLGDRHVLNILIDKTTAELIHIDLGVAFEQGRILPTPETIPFRLTRDIVDGMGMSGPEGVFRKSSEMTMEVLRKNSDIIITVLQVLLYDPLYMWTLSSDRVARVQPSDGTKGGRKSKSNNEPTEESANERNNAASRVLLRLRQKLMGIEEEGGQTGAMSSGQSISIDGHVSLLIQRAMDPEKLCKLFAGWQPYL